MTQTTPVATHDRYFDVGGTELDFSQIEKDWSNVGFVVRTQTMTVEQYERMLRND